MYAKDLSPRIVKTILTENKVGGITLTNIKIYLMSQCVIVRGIGTQMNVREKRTQKESQVDNPADF